MSAAEQTIKTSRAVRPKSAPILNRALDAISSVRVGVVTLCVLVILAMTGMLILQQNVEGFDAYYVSLTPAEKLVFGSLGLFDIYHSWYFNLVLLVLSLNIVLASIDRFPSSWSYVVQPKLTATKNWLLARPVNKVLDYNNGTVEEISGKIETVFKENGLSSTMTSEKGITYV